MLAVLFLVLYLLSGNRTTVPNTHTPARAHESGHSAPTIQEVLSGDFKRTPKKNPDSGAGRLRCLVLDSAGHPVRGASVQVTPMDTNASILEPRPEYREYCEAETTDGGGVTFRTLPAGRFLVVASHGDNHALAPVTVPASGAFGEASLILNTVVPVQGVVRGADGAAVEGAVVVPIHAPDWGGDASVYRALPVETDDEGAFIHPLLPPGDWQLLVAKKNFAPQLVTAREGEPVSVQLGQGVDYSGRVVLETGEKALSGVKVLVQAADATGETYSTRTNGQGVFSVENLRPASYQLSLVSGSHFGQQTIRVTTSGANDDRPATPAARNMRVDPLTGTAVATSSSTTPSVASNDTAPALPVLTARLAGSVRGRVVTGPAETGVAGVEIAAYSIGASSPIASSVSDQAGYYNVMSLPPGEYTVAPSRSGDRVFSAQLEPVVTVLESQQTAGPVFSEVPTVSLSGQVLSDGMLAGEANLTLEITGVAGGPWLYGTDADGRFTIGGLCATDQVQLQASHMATQSSVFGPVTVGAEGLREIVLRLDPS